MEIAVLHLHPAESWNSLFGQTSVTEGTVLSYSNHFVCLENSDDFQNRNSQLQLNVMVFEVPSNGTVVFCSALIIQNHHILFAVGVWWKVSRVTAF